MHAPDALGPRDAHRGRDAPEDRLHQSLLLDSDPPGLLYFFFFPPPFTINDARTKGEQRGTRPMTSVNLSLFQPFST